MFVKSADVVVDHDYPTLLVVFFVKIIENFRSRNFVVAIVFFSQELSQLFRDSNLALTFGEYCFQFRADFFTIVANSFNETVAKRK